MANPEHVKIVKQGAEAIAKWCKHNPRKRFDLSRAELGEANLRSANLRSANLKGANLEGADLSFCLFPYTDFTNANLSGTELSYSSFNLAKMENARLNDATLGRTHFSGAKMNNANLRGSQAAFAVFSEIEFTGVNFTNVWLQSTIFSDCDFRGAIGLSEIRHFAPSTIGVDTILRSKGDIPVEFLRDCGLPDRVIDFVKSIAQRPIQFYSCFISHSSKDEPFPSHLYERLQKSDVRCYYFPRTARTGEKLWEEIDRAIHLHDKEIIICSVNALNSKPVIGEIEKGLKREKEEAVRKLKDADLVAEGKLAVEDYAARRYQTRVLFPITIDDYLFEGWNHPLKTEICNRVVADFRGWDYPKIFNTQFEKLLHDLNAQDVT